MVVNSGMATVVATPRGAADFLAARALYASLGFRDTGAYDVNPNGDVKYLELVL